MVSGSRGSSGSAGSGGSAYCCCCCCCCCCFYVSLMPQHKTRPGAAAARAAGGRAGGGRDVPRVWRVVARTALGCAHRRRALADYFKRQPGRIARVMKDRQMSVKGRKNQRQICPLTSPWVPQKAVLPGPGGAPTLAMAPSATASSPVRARVLADFVAEMPGGLTVSTQNEVLLVVDAPVSEGWSLVIRGEESGLVPTSYVEPLPELSRRAAPAIVRADFAAQHDAELSVSAGDVVWLLEPQPTSTFEGWTAVVHEDEVLL